MDLKLTLYLIFGDFWSVFQGCTSSRRLNFGQWYLIFFILIVELVSCHTSGGRNFEVAPTFFKICAPLCYAIKTIIWHVWKCILVLADRTSYVLHKRFFFIYWTILLIITNAKIEHFRNEKLTWNDDWVRKWDNIQQNSSCNNFMLKKNLFHIKCYIKTL